MESSGSALAAGRSRRVHIRVEGVVQGVGFRPFVHRQATRLGLSGSVRNTTGHLEIEVEGPGDGVQSLIDALRDGPPSARVGRVSVDERPVVGQDAFVVVESASTIGGEAAIGPDTAICPRCLDEMNDPRDRRHDHPFINCTDCGPRFTIIESVPYDRERTAMRDFPLCPRCSDEYADPGDRRFHAEAIVCPECGPGLRLMDGSGSVMSGSVPAIARARELLREGRIVAIKGLGGFHLACDATRDSAVERLRRLKGRPDRPMAVMCRDLATARAYCRISEQEARLLTGPARPIVLLERRPEPEPGRTPLSPAVAGSHAELGVMLPYTPLHHRLMDTGNPPWLVMTSGNRSGEPLVTDSAEAPGALGGIADAILDHDRRIVNRCDDSVAMVSLGRTVLLRRSRGYVPLAVELDEEVAPTLALGAMTSNAFAVARGRCAYLSQHIGDVDSTETLSFLREAVERLCRLLKIEPVVVAHDMHPDLLTTRLAHEISAGHRRVAVQHHHAHLVAAMAAEGLTGCAQGLVLDGTGWGTDGTIWGCELLVGSAGGFERAGYLRPLPLPGGEAAIRRPLRTAAAYLHVLVPGARGAALDLWRRAGDGEATLVRRLVDRGFNSSMTSSAGRLFDAVSSLLGVCDDVTYEGQAAIELEQIARRGSERAGPRLHIAVEEREEGIVLDPGPLLTALVEGLLDGTRAADLAAGFHRTLAGSLAEACRIVRERGGPKEVLLCGGAFQNRILTRLTSRALGRVGLVPVTPGPVPVSDAGLALGQVMIAHGREE